MDIYTEDLLPADITPEQRTKLTKDYKAMPEQFYSQTGFPVITPKNVEKFVKHVQKENFTVAITMEECAQNLEKVNITKLVSSQNTMTDRRVILLSWQHSLQLEIGIVRIFIRMGSPL